MRLTLVFLTLTLIAACGADGPPEPPATGFSVEGEVIMGITTGPTR